jgi:hypothetical protein
MAPRKPLSKWDTLPQRGSYDWILNDIATEMARMTPPPPPEPPADPPRLPRLQVAVEIVDRRAMARDKRRQDQWAMAIMVWLVVIAILGMAWLGKLL